ncbi:ATP-binding cassette domain-containing protein [Herbiconiux sp. KACC 21604]|uniref:ATP-binding cassette domain-containing protein n=1 Tax=unclassified Herbiconiux TaxID=2618217 RepID=UPI001597F329|nr:ATP-binding cassette domain-containing protein [Herbiconiux sp. SALV-R1]QJU55908.1 ATP-binding cassette domain-containing protein [Herbiconiux sp. SALV-R1]WPO88666.1 ATP-binding cassette domain-containing protein [Herbiconiux sp. KACC 21604]
MNPNARIHGDWAVEAHGLVKVFGDNRAVDGVDLSVRTGTVYGVLGPNGAGKTTTIRMLATLLKPDGGEATVFGHDIRREAQIVRQLIGVTGQYASVDETLSATENLVLFSRLNGLSRKDAHKKSTELLEEFGLTEAAKRPLKKFSGGMRRRLDLAASLISQPPLIFLDEPTTGLDPRTRAQMWDTIRRLVSTGSTVLLTTQYLDEADQLADRIAVIDRGVVVAEGTADELKGSVGQASLLLRLADAANLERARFAILDVLGVESVLSPEAGRVTAPMTDPDSVTDLLIRLRADGIAVAELSVQQPTLDEVFLALTGHAAGDGTDAADASRASGTGAPGGAPATPGASAPELELETSR